MPATAQAPPQQRQQKPTQSQLVAAVIAALASAVTVAALVAALRGLFRAAGIGAAALTAVAGLILSWPQDVMEGTGPATRWAVRTNAMRRAQFFLAACKRVQGAVTEARSHGEPLRAAIADAIAAERRYMAMHIGACSQRITAASRVDGMAAVHGNLLGWQAVKDARCSPGCAKASGKNFRADRPPMIEGHPSYPGAVHPSCRCIPVRAFRDAPVLP